MISIVIPVIRPDGAARCVAAIDANCGGLEYEIVMDTDVDRIGCPKMVKKLVGMSHGEYVMFLGDDTIPQLGFLTEALKVMDTLPDGIGLVALNDGFHHGKLATHWLAHRDLLPMLDGEFFHTGYMHCFCDNELTSRCMQMGRYAYAEKAMIIHDNPLVQGGELDSDLKKVYNKKNFMRDRLLFMRRANNGWKT